MNKVFVLAILAGFTAIATSFPLVSRPNADTRCSTTPPQWFGQFRQIGWDIKKPADLVFRIANASYDRTAEKMKIMDMDVGFNGSKTVTLLDYKAKVQYQVVNGKCTNSSLTDPMPSFGVPSTATYEASEYLGASLPNLGVFVNAYYEIDYRKNIYLSSYAPVSGDECVPVLISDLSVQPDFAMELYYFANVTTTLPDDPFSKPPECS